MLGAVDVDEDDGRVPEPAAACCGHADPVNEPRGKRSAGKVPVDAAQERDWPTLLGGAGASGRSQPGEPDGTRKMVEQFGDAQHEAHPRRLRAA